MTVRGDVHLGFAAGIKHSALGAKVARNSRKGDCWDNAAMESFFASLKKERIYTKSRYRTRDEARADIFEYIERFYNPQRRHSTLGQVSPVEFERRFSTQCT